MSEIVKKMYLNGIGFKAIAEDSLLEKYAVIKLQPSITALPALRRLFIPYSLGRGALALEWG